MSLREAVELEKTENHRAWKEFFQKIGSNPSLKDKTLSIGWNPLWDFTARQTGAAGNTAAIFSAQNRRCMPISAEVSFGGAIISFARTFFQENPE